MKGLIGLVLASVIAAPAFAADMPVPAPVYGTPPPPPPLVFSWIDWYVGANAGFSTALNIPADPFDSPGFGGLLDPPRGNVFAMLSPSGFIGGQVGYDWQVHQVAGWSRQ
jgi:opacity protein-like surface antigen